MYVPTALVVDDDPSWLEWLDFHLSRSGWRTITLDRAEDTLAYFCEHGPDVVVLDERMPGVTGSELAAQLRDLGFGGPMMLMSAGTDQDMLVRCARLSAECVSKLSQAIFFAVMSEWRDELIATHPVTVIDLRDEIPDGAGRLRRLLRLVR